MWIAPILVAIWLAAIPYSPGDIKAFFSELWTSDMSIASDLTSAATAFFAMNERHLYQAAPGPHDAKPLYDLIAGASLDTYEDQTVVTSVAGPAAHRVIDVESKYIRSSAFVPGMQFPTGGVGVFMMWFYLEAQPGQKNGSYPLQIPLVAEDGIFTSTQRINPPFATNMPTVIHKGAISTTYSRRISGIASWRGPMARILGLQSITVRRQQTSTTPTRPEQAT